MPSRPVELLPDALAEARATYDWYFERNPTAAAAFLAELDQAVDEISNAPERWPVFLHGTRRFILRRFPFSVVYRATTSVIRVVAVAHARRRPGYWRNR